MYDDGVWLLVMMYPPASITTVPSPVIRLSIDSVVCDVISDIATRTGPHLRLSLRGGIESLPAAHDTTL
jgi:hypothetical protein